MLAIYFFFLPHQNSVVPAPFLEQTVLFPLNWQLYKKPTDPVFLSYFIPEISVFILMPWYYNFNCYSFMVPFDIK